MPAGTRVRILQLIVLLCLSAGAASAQVVVGTVVDPSTNAPVRGAFVALLNAQGGRVAGSLSDERGAFVFRTQPGTYSVRAERIGHRTTTSAAFTLQAQQTHTLRLSLEVAALRLKEIDVRGENRCGRPDDSKLTAQVWAEARKALTVAAWAQSGGAVYQSRSYELDRDAQLQPIGTPIYRFTSLAGKKAYRAIDPDTVARYGFIRDTREGRIMYGLDAELLLSNTFLGDHCFRVERRADQRGLIGLSFEPTRRRRVPDVNGTLWLDERTAELRFIEYGFTGVSGFEDRTYAGGRTEFEQLPNGAWIVRRWYVRSPRILIMGDGKARMQGAHEEGAEILDVRLATSEASTSLVRRHRVRGEVFDSVYGLPLGFARVYLSGTPYTTTTSASGLFVLDSIPEGDYRIAFDHPRLDSLPKYPPAIPISVDGRRSSFDLGTPSLRSLIAASCDTTALKKVALERRDTLASAEGLLFGTVRTPHGLADNAEVVVSWQRITNSAGGQQRVPLDQILVKPLRLSTDTDGNGRYVLCGVEPERVLQLTVQQRGRTIVKDTLIVARPGIRRVDLPRQ